MKKAFKEFKVAIDAVNSSTGVCDATLVAAAKAAIDDITSDDTAGKTAAKAAVDAITATFTGKKRVAKALQDLCDIYGAGWEGAKMVRGSLNAKRAKAFLPDGNVAGKGINYHKDNAEGRGDNV